ncbi:MAG: hypothetical protein J7576_23720 [Siphonobacter aquaeclarae]|nr:hypothetical protein [Siphonobacter aquaeclarae]
MQPILISEHPDVPGVVRQAVVLAVNNDLQNRVLTLVVEIRHFTPEGLPHEYLRPFRKHLTATDTNFIDPSTGQSVPTGTPGSIAEYVALEAGLGEMYFGMIGRGVINADARQSFNVVPE